MEKISLTEINKKLDALLLISKGILKTQIVLGKSKKSSKATQEEEKTEQEAE